MCGARRGGMTVAHMWLKEARGIATLQKFLGSCGPYMYGSQYVTFSHIQAKIHT
jgi:hypothetical protein